MRPLSTTKGELIEILIELQDEDEKAILIHPLAEDAHAIIFSHKEKIDSAYFSEDPAVILIDANGIVIKKYPLESPISEITNTVLYPNGKVWEGSVFDADEKSKLQSIILTEEAAVFMDGFDNDAFEKVEEINSAEDISFSERPTIVARYEDNLARPMCGWHRCNKCRYMGKFVNDVPISSS